MLTLVVWPNDEKTRYVSSVLCLLYEFSPWRPLWLVKQKKLQMNNKMLYTSPVLSHPFWSSTILQWIFTSLLNSSWNCKQSAKWEWLLVTTYDETEEYLLSVEFFSINTVCVCVFFGNLGLKKVVVRHSLSTQQSLCLYRMRLLRYMRGVTIALFWPPETTLVISFVCKDFPQKNQIDELF